MRRTILVLAGLATICSLPTFASGWSQITREEAYRNPYTGNTAVNKQAYNPYTGREAEQTNRYNPYTGRDVSKTETYNPYTGRTSEERSVDNRYTGRSTAAYATRRR
jgi:hypothetical protein